MPRLWKHCTCNSKTECKKGQGSFEANILSLLQQGSRSQNCRNLFWEALGEEMKTIIKFDRQGKDAWIASWNDNYKKYLVRAE